MHTHVSIKMTQLNSNVPTWNTVHFSNPFLHFEHYATGRHLACSRSFHIQALTRSLAMLNIWCKITCNLWLGVPSMHKSSLPQSTAVARSAVYLKVLRLLPAIRRVVSCGATSSYYLSVASSKLASVESPLSSVVMGYTRMYTISSQNILCTHKVQPWSFGE